jgi:hypothetical protein
MSRNWSETGPVEGARKRRWTGYEIALMVVGFVLFWPVGLAILFAIIWHKKHGKDLPMPGFMKRATDQAAEAMRPGPAPMGNTAFEAWRAAELERLEEERRRLQAAEREFTEFVDELKRARDREEFDWFMRARADRASAAAAAATAAAAGHDPGRPQA